MLLGGRDEELDGFTGGVELTGIDIDDGRLVAVDELVLLADELVLPDDELTLLTDELVLLDDIEGATQVFM